MPQEEAKEELLGQDDDVGVEDKYEDEYEEDNAGFAPSNGLLTFLLLAIFLVAAALGVGVYYLIDSLVDSDDPTTAPITVPTVAPVTPKLAPVAPTPAPITPTTAPTHTEESILALLESVVGSEVYEEGTSQYLAARWLLEDDPQFAERVRLLRQLDETNLLCTDLAKVESLDQNTLGALAGVLVNSEDAIVVDQTVLCLDSTLVEVSTTYEGSSCFDILALIPNAQLTDEALQGLLGEEYKGNGIFCLDSASFSADHKSTVADNSTACFDLSLIQGAELPPNAFVILGTLLAGSNASLVNETVLCLPSASVEYQDDLPCIDVLEFIDVDIALDDVLDGLFGAGYKGDGILCVELADADPISPGLFLLSDSALIQRYLLVLLYYQTAKNRETVWASDCVAIGDSVGGTNECEYVVPARSEDGRLAPDIDSKKVFASRWLSADPECNWAGITCTEDGSSVEKIELVNFDLSGTLGTEILQLPKLAWVDFSHNQLKGSLPLNYSKTLRVLHLNGNSIGGDSLGTDAFWEGSSLAILNVGENLLAGTLPANITSLELQEFWAYANVLTGSLPASLVGDESSLRVLSLANNYFEGALPFIGKPEPLIGQTLERLDLSFNKLEGAVSVHSEKLTSLRLAANNFEGTFPSDIGRSTMLSDIDLTKNRFDGTLPNELTLLQDLKSLKVGQNFFSGTLQPEISNLTKLEALDVNDNNLSGALPESIILLTDLKTVDFSSNGFKGTISTVLGQLTKLEEFQLDDNFFSGTIPTELLPLTELEVFTFDNNDLIGSLPDDFCGGSYEFEVLRADCTEILCSCCTECCVDGVCDGTSSAASSNVII